MQDDQEALAVLRVLLVCFFKEIYLFLCVRVFGLRVCPRGQKTMLDPPGIGGIDVWSHHVGAGEQTGIIWKAAISPVSELFFLFCFDTISCSLGWPPILYVAPRIPDPPAFPFQI